jgi:hypothetical protein
VIGRKIEHVFGRVVHRIVELRLLYHSEWTMRLYTVELVRGLGSGLHWLIMVVHRFESVWHGGQGLYIVRWGSNSFRLDEVLVEA